MVCSKDILKQKEFPLIPLLIIDNKLEQDFWKRQIPSTSFFSSKWTTTKRKISAPPNFLEYDSEARLSEINFTNEKILKILRSLVINKAHGHDDASISAMKLNDQSIIAPQFLIFQNCIDIDSFPDNW